MRQASVTQSVNLTGNKQVWRGKVKAEHNKQDANWVLGQPTQEYHKHEKLKEASPKCSEQVCWNYG